MIPQFGWARLPAAVGLVALLLACAPTAAAEQGVARVVRPVAAGSWFPADAGKLQTLLDGLYKDADAGAAASLVSGKLVACIVPHAPYATSGGIAVSTLRLLQPGQYERVIILAAAHHSQFRGCSIPSAQAYITPLGVVPIDCPLVRELDRLSPLIEVRSLNYGKMLERQPLHERETTIEVMLPYLQVRLGTFVVVPIMVGELKDYGGNLDIYAIDAIASVLARYVDEKTLIVVSSDFTHFGNNFSYRPFKENILEGIEALDRTAFNLILARNSAGYYDYLQQTENTICGKEAIALLLKLLPQGASGTVTGYDISARRTGDTKTSISYAAIAFTMPQQVQAAK
ncbi:MAG TPA: AmmeMemoRadiSam system protein B [Candidatus Bathyarchaeia archaeon]|nr:AmmeMemoRadiSam system protein B [Candidatus Bathyarchaeia archaeon]